MLSQVEVIWILSDKRVLTPRGIFSSVIFGGQKGIVEGLADPVQRKSWRPIVYDLLSALPSSLFCWGQFQQLLFMSLAMTTRKLEERHFALQFSVLFSSLNVWELCCTFVKNWWKLRRLFSALIATLTTHHQMSYRPTWSKWLSEAGEATQNRRWELGLWLWLGPFLWNAPRLHPTSQAATADSKTKFLGIPLSVQTVGAREQAEKVLFWMNSCVN